MELRANKGTVELRQNAAGEPVIFGYFAVFNRDSSDMGFIEQVDPSAFNRTLNVADVRGLGNHDPNWLLGRSKPGTLRVGADLVGGWYEIDVNMKDPDGQRAVEKVRRGDWDGSSFSFQCMRDEWNWDATPPQRKLLEVALIDVGPVTYPAYPDATAAARALDPIAERCGRPVEELVAAMKVGEMRSILNPKEAMLDTTNSNAVVDVPLDAEALTASLADFEERAGKTMSAANMEKLSAAMQSLRDLMDAALGEQPADSDVAAVLDQGADETEENAFAVEMEMRLLEFAAREHAYAA